MVALKEGREARDRTRTLVVHPIRILGAPEEAMVVAQIIWHMALIWVVLVETGVPLAEEEGEGEEVLSLREDLLVVRLDPWDQGDQEFMGDQVGQELGEGEVQEVGSNNRSREAGGETEKKQETEASQICHNLPIVISLSGAVVHWL